MKQAGTIIDEIIAKCKFTSQKILNLKSLSSDRF